MDQVPIRGDRGKELLMVGTILCLALLLRLFHLDFNSLWLDEAVSVSVAEGPVRLILASARLDSQPPLYALFLHFWLPLGSSDFILRFPSLLFGILSVAVLYRLARLLFQPGAALFSAALLAIAPLHIWYSQEARSYALVTLCAVVSVYCFFRFLSRNDAFSWIAYVLVTLAGLYANYGMVLVIAGQDLYLLWLLRSGKKGLSHNVALGRVLSRGVGGRAPDQRGFETVAKRLGPRWLVGQAVLLLGFSPWFPYVSDSLQEAAKDYQTLNTIGQLLARSGTYFGGPALVWTLSGLVAGALAPIALAGYLLWARRPHLLQKQAFLLSLTMGAYAIVTVLSATPQGASLRRQLLIFLPFFLLAVSLGARRLSHGRLYLAAALLLVTAPALYANYFINQKEQWREVAQALEARGKEGDMVVLHASWAIDAFRHYYSGGLPYRGTPLEGLSIELKQAVSSHERVWLVLNNERYRDPQGTVRQWFDGCYKNELQSDFSRISVRLYEVGRRGCPP